MNRATSPQHRGTDWVWGKSLSPYLSALPTARAASQPSKLRDNFATRISMADISPSGARRLWGETFGGRAAGALSPERIEIGPADPKGGSATDR